MPDSAPTIAAISTAVTGPGSAGTPGTAGSINSARSAGGGIGIVRLSGAEALRILQNLFSKKIGPEPAPPFAFTPRRMEHGWICDAGAFPLDEVLAVFMPGPHTFTGEDVAEIHCHGGKAVLQAILGATVASGARLAAPGEFTRRAFLNGRLDLSQAEAVAEMISAPTLQGVYLARNKLEGRLSGILNELRAELDVLRARLYLCIDFPDEADEALARHKGGDGDFMARLDGIIARITELILAYERACVWREGARAALAGQVNVGKSSLLNALLGRKRALVSASPGTTRDFIEEALNLGGIPLRLVDTAGFRAGADSLDPHAPADALEAEGMDFAQEIFAEADLILLVLEAGKFLQGRLIRVDGPEDLDRESAAVFNRYGPPSRNNKLFIVLNKMDLCPACAVPEEFLGCPCQGVSARTGSGLDNLAESLRRFIVSPPSSRDGDNGALDFSSAAVPGLRQTLKLKEVKAELSALKNEFKGDIPADLLSVRLDSAAAYLADVTGASCSEEILDQVFAGFCIGK
ncbi:MAG: tRNA uridine-5-carboxymethylaminomethyl(34) synthesis GTPase MnmE [Deltaproteobacteria bacterium]|jgi:tRNA modification GTPase|nr:tRNA uridine-5-carboxymethylaminomethyl(34) synthesis GTPase MnmE [Deltaproteobacteria bacterium]